jgi:hypothetical protein
MYSTFSRRYLYYILFLVCTLSSFVILANIIYRWNKVPIEWHNNLFFFSDVKKNKPQSVIIGSSRTDAFRTHSPGDPRVVTATNKPFEWGPDINSYAVLTLYNASATEIELGLKESQAFQNAKSVYVGLDFFAANAFFPISGYYPVDFLRKARIAIISYASIQTWLSELFNALGIRLTNYIPPKSTGATYRLATYRYFRKLYENGNNLNYLHYPWISYSPSISSIDKMLSSFESGSSENLYLFLTPTHSWALEAIYRAGLWDNYQAWRRHLVARVDNINASLNPKRHVHLWDFDGFNCLAIEDPRVKQPIFWSDVDHFHAEIATLILNRMNGKSLKSINTGCDLNQFGLKLTSENIEFHLNHLLLERDNFHRLYPDQVLEIDSIFNRNNRFRQKIF